MSSVISGYPENTISRVATKLERPPCTPVSAVIIPCLISAVALFVIGCMGAARTFPHSSAALGRTTLGLGTGLLAVTLIAYQCTPKKDRFPGFLAIMTILLSGAIIGGALGIGGTANMKQIGWATIGPSMPFLGFILIECYRDS